jgi:hypothetical protein
LLITSKEQVKSKKRVRFAVVETRHNIAGAYLGVPIKKAGIKEGIEAVFPSR